MKRRYNFGQAYLLEQCRLGIAMIRGEKHYWLTDGYTKWLITDMDPEKQTVQVRVWER